MADSISGLRVEYVQRCEQLRSRELRMRLLLFRAAEEGTNDPAAADIARMEKLGAECERLRERLRTIIARVDALRRQTVIGKE